MEQYARLTFFNDYCIASSDQNSSRGYLSGLRTLVLEAGSSSEIAQACTIISLATSGKKLGNDACMTRAEDLYLSLLPSFRLRIAHEVRFATVESFMTATLLGLYQIITSTAARPCAHVAHARGVSAILFGQFSPFAVVCGVNLFQMTSPTPSTKPEVDSSESIPRLYCPAIIKNSAHKFSILCTPFFNQSTPALDVLYTQTEPLIRRTRSLLATEATVDQLRHLQMQAEKLKREYDAWPVTVPKEWKPRSVGVFPPKNNQVTPDIGCWPGLVLSYHDAYIAFVWNSYRKAVLIVLSIITTCHRRINRVSDDLEIDTSTHKDATALTQGIVSSIPYFLTADLEAFVDRTTAGSPSLVSGRPVGGLLLMNTLYVLLTLPIVEPKLKVYIRDCLVWIGTHMGIGQATILSQCTTKNTFEYSAEANLIIWAVFASLSDVSLHTPQSFVLLSLVARAPESWPNVIATRLVIAENLILRLLEEYFSIEVLQTRYPALSNYLFSDAAHPQETFSMGETHLTYIHRLFSRSFTPSPLRVTNLLRAYSNEASNY